MTSYYPMEQRLPNFPRVGELFPNFKNSLNLLVVTNENYVDSRKERINSSRIYQAD